MTTYALSRGCDVQLNEWCDRNCPHAASHGALYARFDSNIQGGPRLWRCYASETLSSDTQRYMRGDTYCTRHPLLLDRLAACLRERESIATQLYSAAGSNSAVSQTCSDSVAECPLWAKYGECTENREWMAANCPYSCHVCAAASRPPVPDPHSDSLPPPQLPPEVQAHRQLKLNSQLQPQPPHELHELTPPSSPSSFP